MSRPPFDYMAERPEYGLSKATGTTAMQFIAQDANPDEIQVVSYHPGIAYSETWQTSGVPQDALPFDDSELSNLKGPVMSRDYANLAQSKCRATMQSGRLAKRLDFCMAVLSGRPGTLMSWQRVRSGRGLTRSLNF